MGRSVGRCGQPPLPFAPCMPFPHPQQRTHIEKATGPAAVSLQPAEVSHPSSTALPRPAASPSLCSTPAHHGGRGAGNVPAAPTCKAGRGASQRQQQRPPAPSSGPEASCGCWVSGQQQQWGGRRQPSRRPAVGVAAGGACPRLSRGPPACGSGCSSGGTPLARLLRHERARPGPAGPRLLLHP